MFPITIIDLTHTLNSTIPTWAGEQGFTLSTLLTYENCTTTTKFHVQKMMLENGVGTHMDAPAHCITGGKTIADYTPQELFLECITLDFSENISSPDHVISINDLMNHQHIDTIIKGYFVLIHTSWSKRWNDADTYRNNLVFPTISIEVAQFLADKSIAGIGIDTLSIDQPQTFEYPQSAHTIFLKKGIFIIENVANAHCMPTNGAHILIAPLKIEHATEAPVRLLGFIF